jgi:hypothetical protein
MIRLRLASAILFAAAFAGFFTYYVTSPPLIEAEQRLVLAAADAAGSAAAKPTKIAEHLTVEDYERAAEAILKRLPEAQASARTDELPIIGHIPLPKPRPIPR